MLAVTEGSARQRAMAGVEAAAQGLMPKDTAERREWLRFDLERATSLTVEANGHRYDCVVEDISLGGLRLRFRDTPPHSEKILLHHHKAGAFSGKPVWRGEAQLGLAFGLPERELEHLLQCISLILNPDETERAQPEPA